MLEYFVLVEYGNAGSRTHEIWYAVRSQAVKVLGSQVAKVVEVSPDVKSFLRAVPPSRTTLEYSCSLEHGEKTGRKHIVSTEIEHKAVLAALAGPFRTWIRNHFGEAKARRIISSMTRRNHRDRFETDTLFGFP